MESNSNRANRQALPWALGLITAGIVGCAAPPEAPEDWRGRLNEMTAAPVEASMTLGPATTGENTDEAAAARPGYLEGVLLARSEVDYILRRDDGPSDADHWLLKVRAPEMPTKPRAGWISMTTQPDGKPKRMVHRRAKPYRGKLTVVVDGKEKAKSPLVLPLAFFGTSLFEACELAQTTSLEEIEASGGTGEADDPVALARAAFTAMALAAGRNSAVEMLLKRTVTWPDSGLFSKPELMFGMEPELFDATPVSTQFGPGYRLPVEFQINGESAFFGSFTVVEPRGALLLTAGVVEVVGYAPHDPDARVHLALAGGALPKTGRLGKEGVVKLLAVEPELRIDTDTIGAPKD